MQIHNPPISAGNSGGLRLEGVKLHDHDENPKIGEQDQFSWNMRHPCDILE
jgi:hypothetical protein